MTFSEKLIRLRRREGLSQEVLAEVLGVHSTRINPIDIAILPQ